MTALHTLLLLTALGANPLGPGDYTRTLRVGNLDRPYLVHIPRSYKATTPTPVVLAFHGGGDNVVNMVKFSGLSIKAESANFVVVYPAGTGAELTFNAGNCCGYAMEAKVDDVEFTRKILDDLAGVVTIDPKRVFATGMSNGGMMAYRLASELSDRIAAIAPVSGPIGTPTCGAPTRPVPVMHFHGTVDKYIPFNGGTGQGNTGTNFYSVQYSTQAWAAFDGCKTTPVTTQLRDKVNDGTTVTRNVYSTGRDGSEVVQIVINGGGHTWPGQRQSAQAVELLGKSTLDVSANDMMWEFFKKHPMK